MTRLRSGVVHRSAVDSPSAGSADVVGSSSGGHMATSVRGTKNVCMKCVYVKTCVHTSMYILYSIE